MRAAIDDMPMPAVMAELVETGIVERIGDRYDLTELGAEVIARQKGWARGEDQDGDECFLDTLSYNHFSYVRTWRELVAAKGLSELSRTVAQVMAG